MPDLSGSMRALYSDKVLEKAEELVDGDALARDDVYDTVWWVEGASRVYRVQVVEGSDDDGLPFVLCDCPNGARKGGRPTCYHSAAVLMKIS